MQRINKLDGLRGLFSLFVVLFHFNKNNAPLYIVNNFFIRESYIFVDFFFILSGYVISLTYDQRIHTANTFFHFLKKRFIRLYPLLLFSTLMYWYFVHPHFDKKNILLALDTLLLTNATPLLGSDIGMNYPSWSISSEMISYIVFGLCSLIAIQKKKKGLLLFITICCFTLLGFQQDYFLTGSYGFIRGLACFNLGYFIFSNSGNQIKVHNSFEWIISIVIIGLMYFHYTFTFTNTMQLFSVQILIPIAFATCIFILIKTNGLISKLLNSTPLLFLGKISYSVYLNHAFVIGYGIPKLYSWIHFNDSEMKKSICMFLLLMLLFLYSWATQYFIENKLGKKLNRYIKH